ncbi:MAG: DUF6017 domain-containing protein [Lachnospiraceae bacterium]|nr:DUF6017 domain-containing protein [Lachnospiraceae bacterium]
MKDKGETQKKVFGYFRAYESEQFSFYRIPKVLFTDAYFKELSTEAKVLYGLMLDRMALSERNQWFDETGRVYIIFTVEEVMSCMNCGRDKSVKILAELDARKGIGLIERVRRGLGQPDIIYVKNFIRTEAAEETQSFLKSGKPTSGVRKSRLAEVGKADFKSSEKSISRVRKSRLLEVGKTDFLKSEKPTSGVRKSRLLEVGKADLSSSEKPTSGVRKNRLLEVGKTDPNNTDKSETESNKTDRSEINSIYPSDRKQSKRSDDLIDVEQPIDSEQIDKKDQMQQFEFYTELIKQNISYDILRHDCKIGEEQLLDEIVAIVAEFLSMQRETVLVGGVKYPYQYVRNRFLLLDDAHIRYVLECFQKNTTEVRNIKAYLLSSMLNATNTIDLYYQAKAQHDLRADGMT